MNPPSAIIRKLIDGFFFQKLGTSPDKNGKNKFLSEIKLDDNGI